MSILIIAEKPDLAKAIITALPGVEMGIRIVTYIF